MRCANEHPMPIRVIDGMNHWVMTFYPALLCGTVRTPIVAVPKPLDFGTETFFVAGEGKYVYRYWYVWLLASATTCY